MFIFNVTTKVEWSVAGEWVDWMKNSHIPEVLSTGCFNHYQFVRLIEIDDDDGPTYAVQYYATSGLDYEKYMQHFENGLKHKALNKWGNKFIAFRSLMETVS
jgi:hypothetical protein